MTIFAYIVYYGRARGIIILIIFLFSVVIGSHSNAIKLHNEYQEENNIEKKPQQLSMKFGV
jgi:hypothetical protein